MTKKKAIEISIELWTWLAETGKRKFAWDGWKKYGEMDCDCALCEYVNQQIDDLRDDEGCQRFCPYAKKFGLCQGDEEDIIYDKWNLAVAPKTRKKYAKLFLEQLKEL